MVVHKTLIRYVHLMSSQICLSVVCLSVSNVGTFYSEGWTFQHYFHTIL